MMGSMIRIVIGFAVVCGLTLGVALTSAADSGFKYIGASKCRTCHKKELIGDQWSKWEESGHAKAFKTLEGEKAIAVAKEKGISGPPSEAAECLKCHATAATLGAGDVEKKPLSNSDGVQCETCHGPGSGYKKKKVMADHEKSLAAGLIVPDEKTCTQCHNDESPTFKGFDYAEASKKIAHMIPEDVKGKYIEVEKARKAEGK
jgi:cytochrome c peroxidase